MKTPVLCLSAILLSASWILGITSAGAQTALPFDFELTPDSADFVNFDGGLGDVVANPIQDAVNSSESVGKIIRDGGEVWAGSKIFLPAPLDLENSAGFRMKVLSPIGGIIAKLKLEGPGVAAERDVVIEEPGVWTEVEYNFLGELSGVMNEIVFMFDFGNLGNGTDFSTFYFDDVETFDWTGGAGQIDLPITFEEPDVFYGMADFGGNISTLIEWPTGGHVMQVVKPEGAATWSGTTMSTPAGLANPIPLSADASKIYVHTYSPAAGTPLRLKAENALDPTQSVETNAFTTVANAWEIIEFDFNNEAPNTAPLNPSFNFTMVSIFFNFDTEGSAAGEQTYYFDNVSFNEPIVSNISEQVAQPAIVAPNPAQSEWRVQWFGQRNVSWQLLSMTGQIVREGQSPAPNWQIPGTGLPVGVYLLRMTDAKGAHQTMRLSKLAD